MAVVDEYPGVGGLVGPPERSPYDVIEAHRPGETRPRPSTTDFDEEKLLAILDEAAEAAAVLESLRERIVDARSALNRARAAVRAESDQYREARPETLARQTRAQAALDRMDAHHSARRTELQPQIALAARCREWAEARGWREDGRRTAVMDAGGAL